MLAVVNINMLGNGGSQSTGQSLGWNRTGRAGIYTMMMTNERKIWEAAMLLVRRHGSDAVKVAESEVERLRGDALTCVVWCWIARSTAELLRPAPEAGERVH
jgi:hypothetical protein